MKKFKFNKVSILVLAGMFIFGFFGLISTFAATAPTLGTTSTYGIVSSTFTNSLNAGLETKIVGDVCYTTGPVIAPVSISGATNTPCTNGIDQAVALAALNIQSCTSLGANVVLSGTYTPGCYSSSGSMDIALSTTVTLNGAGVYIFRSGGALTTGANSVVALTNGASASDVFWTPGGAATLGANSVTSSTPTFVGTIIADALGSAGITLGHFANITGRLLAFGHTVTTDSNTITVPTASTLATFHLRKIVVGGTALNTAWTLTATGTLGLPTNLSGPTPVDSGITFQADTYTLSETGGPSGYTPSLYSCVKNGGAAVLGNSITLVAGDTATCTITNTYDPTLHLRKIVVGGTALNTDWTLTATGTLGSPTNLSGFTPVDSGSTFQADTYTLSETGGPSGYTSSLYSCVKNGGAAVLGNTVSVAAGDDVTCTITNTLIPPGSPTLHLRKTVVGGTALNTAWTLTATGTTILTGTTPVDGSVTSGTYTLSESVGAINHTAGTYSCVKNGGAAVVSNSITLVNGDDATCTITNTYSAPTTSTLNVIKVVVNDDGRINVIADFPLFVDGISTLSGADITLTAGTYTVTETSNSNYTQTFSASCPGGIVTLVAGVPQTCTITNDDIAAPRRSSSGGGYISRIPPILSLVKVPTPLALPAGPGPVIYTYTLRNIGLVPVTNITMTDDRCSPVSYTSGDTDADSKVDLNETWIYRCAAILSSTTTNTASATGWANGISTTDIANATVVVGGIGFPDTGIIPPLIHVTKVPSPLSLLIGWGLVTYTEKVTNPGIVPLNNIRLVDDKCSPVNYISGDLNNDALLDPTETWTYTCNTNLTGTTTNTARVSGDANGITATDFAIATVVAYIPRLPITGFPSQDIALAWGITIMVGLTIVATSIIVLKKYNKKI